MKTGYKLTAILVFILNFVIAQNYEWKKIDTNLYQTSLDQDSKELLQDQDSLMVTIFIFERNEKINLSDSTKHIFSPIKMTYEEFKKSSSPIKVNLKLTLNSEFLIKFKNKTKTYNYEFYLFDSVNQKQLEEFKNYLNENYEIQKLEYISKDKAMDIAVKKLGIEIENLFEDNIFPASLKIQTNKKINIKYIESKFPKTLESSIDRILNSKVQVLKIET